MSNSVDELPFIVLYCPHADVAELADAPDLGSGAARRMGSSPFIRTILMKKIRFAPCGGAGATPPQFRINLEVVDLCNI